MGGIFTPPNELSQISEIYFYMWLKISPRHPVKISAWYECEIFFMIFHRKMVDTKSSKLAQNGKIFKM